MENNDDDSVVSLLKRQLLAGWSAAGLGDRSLYDIQQSDFDITEQVILDSLVKRGFKPLSDSAFAKRIEEVYGITHTKDDIVHINLYPLDKDSMIFTKHPYGTMRDGDEYIMHIDFKKKIISKTYELPDIINYKKEYPELADIDKGLDPKPILKKHFEGEEDEWKIKFWYQLQYDDYEILWLYHFNNYLLNNSNASFAWLSGGDSYFLVSLLTIFGYDKDERINKMTLDNFLGLIPIFVNHDNHGKLKIHEGVLQTIDKNSTETDSHYFEMADYFTYLISCNSDGEAENLEHYPELKTYTTQERRKIVAYMVNYLQPIYERFQPICVNMPGYGNADLYEIGIIDCLWNICFYDNDLLKEIEANDCYGLPNLKKLFERMKADTRFINPKTGALEPWEFNPRAYLEGDDNNDDK